MRSWKLNSFVVYGALRRSEVPIIAAGPAEPCPSQDRCWANEPGGQQCSVAIDEADLLGLCEQHRLLFRDEGEPATVATCSPSSPSVHGATALESISRSRQLAAWRGGSPAVRVTGRTSAYLRSAEDAEAHRGRDRM